MSKVRPLHGNFEGLSRVVLTCKAHDQAIPTAIEREESLFFGPDFFRIVLFQHSSDKDVPFPDCLHFFQFLLSGFQGLNDLFGTNILHFPQLKRFRIFEVHTLDQNLPPFELRKIFHAYAFLE